LNVLFVSQRLDNCKRLIVEIDLHWEVEIFTTSSLNFPSNDTIPSCTSKHIQRAVDEHNSIVNFMPCYTPPISSRNSTRMEFIKTLNCFDRHKTPLKPEVPYL
jgi:hypothetical protein